MRSTKCLILFTSLVFLAFSTVFFFPSVKPKLRPHLSLIQKFLNFSDLKPKPKLIIEWTGIHCCGGVDQYWEATKSFCPELIGKCVFTKNKSLALEADAISFFIRFVDTMTPPPKRLPHQRYILYNGEAPVYTPNLVKIGRSKFFNWTMTINMGSDIWWPFGQFVPMDKVIPTKRFDYGDLRKLVANKTKIVAWYVSNCDTNSKRELYVNELKKYIPIDIYGKCGNLKCNDSAENCEAKLAYEYKFYLSFENAMCEDYITEKMFNYARHFVVPVVLRSKEYEKIDIEGNPGAPNGSYIAADKFGSPQELASYLLYLNNNTEEYLKYFEWRKEWKVSYYYGQNTGMCKMCRMLLDDSLPPKVWGEELQEWYHGTKDKPTCDVGFAKTLLEK